MCGIFAAIHREPVVSYLLNGLSALAYRGYDSAGVAVVHPEGLKRRRAGGKLNNLVERLQHSPLYGHVGIAHTRWATHGGATQGNAHPHMSQQVAVVHNGIIENHAVLRQELESKGYRLHSETDSEVVPWLVTHYLSQGYGREMAIRRTVERLRGSYALVFAFADCHDCLFAIRNNSPLVVGLCADGAFAASDEHAMAGQAETVVHLQDQDLACLSRDGLVILDEFGLEIERPHEQLQLTAQEQGKGEYAHYMLKEIEAQPQALADTLAEYFDKEAVDLVLPEMPFCMEWVTRLDLVACGSSYYAGMIARYWLESIAGLPVDLDLASEYRYRGLPRSEGNVALFVSQSGETADTLAALEFARDREQPILSIVNVLHSRMARLSDVLLPTRAGTEIGVASTKAFSAQLMTLAVLALAAARCRYGLNDDERKQQIQNLRDTPMLVQQVIEARAGVDAAAQLLNEADHALYLGRGMHQGLAYEGALKLKEITYIHAEAYAAGELKHGPLALVDEHMPVVVIAPRDELFEKTLANIREVHARGARVIMLSDAEGLAQAEGSIEVGVELPDVPMIAQPFVYLIPLQLIAYQVAVMRGLDVDQPRNLAKSVTVE